MIDSEDAIPMFYPHFFQKFENVRDTTVSMLDAFSVDTIIASCFADMQGSRKQELSIVRYLCLIRL